MMKGVLYFHSETGTEGGYWAFQDERFIDPSSGQWSYDGLHILRNGDRLHINSKEDSQMYVWNGTIDLIEHPVFTQEAHGLWIHSDQRDVNRNQWARWFLDGLPAELELRPTACEECRQIVMEFALPLYMCEICGYQVCVNCSSRSSGPYKVLCKYC